MSDQIRKLETPTIGELLARQIFAITERDRVRVSDEWRRDVYDSICAAFAHSDRVIKHYEEMAVNVSMLTTQCQVILKDPKAKP